MIDLWSHNLGSSRAYIEAQKRLAREADAPDDATYITPVEKRRPKIGTVATCSSLQTLHQLAGLAASRKLIQCHRIIQARINYLNRSLS